MSPVKKKAPEPPPPVQVSVKLPDRSGISLEELLQHAAREARNMHPDASTTSQMPSREELNERLVALDSLLSNDGWRVFIQYAEVIVNAAERAMADATDAHSAAKHMGAFYALRQLITWPIREGEALRLTLKESQ